MSDERWLMGRAGTERRLWRQAAKIFIGNLLVFSVGVVVFELIFGTWLGTWYDARLLLKRDVEYRTDVRSLYGRSEPAIYRRDQWGLRGNFNDPQSVSIVTIGGSTTDQRFISEGETWQDHLAQNLSRKGRPIAIANAGLDGQSTVGHIVALKGWLFHIPRLRPKLVLVYAGINDVLLEYKRSYDAVPDKELFPRLVQYVEQRSALFSLFRTLIGMVEAASLNLPYKLSEAHLQPTPLENLTSLRRDYADRLDAYADRLDTLDGLIRGWGAVPIFITQPRADRQLVAGEGIVILADQNGRMDPETLALGLFNERTLLFCRRTGAVCVDLARELVLHLDDFYDFNHYTPAGAAKIGDYLAPKIFDQLAKTGLAVSP